MRLRLEGLTFVSARIPMSNGSLPVSTRVCTTIDDRGPRPTARMRSGGGPVLAIDRVVRPLAPSALVCLSLAACGAPSERPRSPAPAESAEASVSTASDEAPATSRAKQLVPPWSSATSLAPVASSAPPVSPAAQRVLETAHRMVDEGTVIRGSCYRYIDTVFTRAGHDGWRRQETVFRAPTRGPYADLDLLQPGDWLFIVNHPESRPVGTHSVIFVRWIDRADGYAETISYVGGGRDRPGDRVGYDVTRTYRIQRAVDPS